MTEMYPTKSLHICFLLLATCTLLAHCALESATGTDQFSDNSEDKNEDALTVHKRPSFFVGSRYGRSGAFASSAKMRRLNVVPRNDRFFLGSRYGKRTNEFAAPYEQNGMDNIPAGVATAIGNNNSNFDDNSAAPFMMSCIYTGLKNYYRCNSIEELNNIVNQLTNNQNDDEGK
ncbi:uncharacterized protein LOC119681977 [Teleopsis dalmanni]|uniref:uncharacterized protein LOC119678708 n=1 Tax=Teleopsis dalmanni TaxID=139649 RepID=UPI0018CE3DE3|nr:uncharacterized protein LOC119678708 [Teleopsis dalmanni]XP_037946630.1 uncharacterized protein LOC119678708 [Teleopsis dalmanni]XP_037951228.1 uncharacterized protein LOC119681977 [Teleopsis dalmanni]